MHLNYDDSPCKCLQAVSHLFSLSLRSGSSTGEKAAGSTNRLGKVELFSSASDQFPLAQCYKETWV